MLVSLSAEGIDKFVADQPTTASTGNKCRARAIVNGYFFFIDQQKWRLQRGDFITKTDGFNCEPIVYLKLMELYLRITADQVRSTYEQGNI